VAQSNNAIRLTFYYKDGVVQLVSKSEVGMVIPPGDPPTKRAEHGFWAELRDASNNTLFRRVLHNPIPTDMEVFSDEPGKSISRAPGGPSEGTFTIVMPNDEAGVDLVLFSSHHEPAQAPTHPSPGISQALPFHAVRAVAGRLEAAREVARFNLKNVKA